MGWLYNQKTEQNYCLKEEGISIERFTLKEQLIVLPYLPMYIETVYTAIELDLFSALTMERTATEVARERGLDQERTSYVLGTLCALGFLEKTRDRFHNTPEADRFLVCGQPVGVFDGEIQEAAMAAGFQGIERNEVTMSCGLQTVYILRKERV